MTSLRRRRLVQVGAALVAAPLSDARSANAAQSAPKTLRVAFPTAETGFDPAQVQDLYSRTVIGHILDAPLEFDFMARPARLRVNTLVADARGLGGLSHLHLPTPRRASTSRTTRRSRASRASWSPPTTSTRGSASTTRAGRVRCCSCWRTARSLGLTELRADVAQGQAAIRLCDRSRRPARARPLHAAAEAERTESALDLQLRRCVALRCRGARGGRGLRRRHHGASGRHRAVPAGGLDALVAHRARAQVRPIAKSCTTSKRPPTFRNLQTETARLRGRRLPLVDRVEISIIEESQPRWLAFLQGQLDLLDPVPVDLVRVAAPNGKLAPFLERKGIKAVFTPMSDITLSYFNIEHPLVGGYTPEKVALRRAIALGFDGSRIHPQHLQWLRRAGPVAVRAPPPSVTTRLTDTPWQSTTRRARRRCSTPTATSTATATAGAKRPRAHR